MSGCFDLKMGILRALKDTYRYGRAPKKNTNGQVPTLEEAHYTISASADLLASWRLHLCGRRMSDPTQASQLLPHRPAI